MTNLANYINLSPKDVEPEKLGGTTIAAFGSRAGMLGLPGDFTPPLALCARRDVQPGGDAEQDRRGSVLSAFHILNQFDIRKGSVVNAAVGDPTPEITEWTSANDLKNLRWYFRTFEDQSIRMVDLKAAVAAAKGKIATIPMEKSEQPIADVSAEVTSLAD
jgi:choloylglycine hydrolase